MELRQLRYFVAIAEHGAFSKAADKVFVAQSALSHQLAQLEDELGVQLLLRTRRGVELTEPGRVFLAHAISILRQTEDARSSVRSALGEPSGKVVFGIPHSVSNALALPLLQAVRQRLPKVELELTEELTGNLIPQLRTGVLNLAVLFDDGHLDEFTTLALLSERLSLIGSTQSPALRVAKSITLKKALALPLILPADPHGVRPTIEAAARKRAYPPPHVVADISSISILRTTLLAGMGHTLLPVMPLRADLDAGTLKAIPVVLPTLQRVVSLCASKHIPISTAATAVAQLTHQLVHDLCKEGAWVDASPIEGNTTGFTIAGRTAKT
ncbi:LysR substrate-binding domain-containing protein [Rhodoferax aquaticus]|uniref:LysR family transcriptional regulator n=1 Tax=Rhodoferax aquaticus TaxID=2527691 RepID=A0A515EM03_9BURK|nr:LysR substrate-binding domain-containing protein [Rhodoferax aquaticus]QDL53692.1 LysR family transcriptional regulator [Rhodoferax aquaticus]